MAGRGQIGPYHKNVASDVEAILGKCVTFRTANEARWHKVRDGSEVEFELAPVQAVQSEVAVRKRREDRPLHRVSVFPLYTPASLRVGTFWVGWHETWLKQDSVNYLLLNAGWTLFEGLPGNEDKDQVLRVDWDQLPHRGSNRAGQPHWHFDHHLFISVEPDKVQVAPGLVEVNTTGVSAATGAGSVGSIHLAMGTWNRDIPHPKCWQRTYEDDCRQLRDWCVKTLKYLKEQVAGS